MKWTRVISGYNGSPKFVFESRIFPALILKETPLATCVVDKPGDLDCRYRKYFLSLKNLDEQLMETILVPLVPWYCDPWCCPYLIIVHHHCVFAKANLVYNFFLQKALYFCFNDLHVCMPAYNSFKMKQTCAAQILRMN